MHRLVWLLLLPFLFVACSDEEDALPSYVQDLADIYTDASGRGVSLLLDNGDSLLLTNGPAFSVADSVYRINVLYVRDGVNVHLTDYAAVLSPKVAKYAADKVVCDPLDIVACWKGGRYVNLRLAMKATATGRHYFGFHQTDYVRHADGKRTMKAVLLHDQNNDPLYYTRETYISLPLRPLEPLLVRGRDSISLSVETFEGNKNYTFPF